MIAQAEVEEVAPRSRQRGAGSKSIRVSERALAIMQETAARWGISQTGVIEIALRALEQRPVEFGAVTKEVDGEHDDSAR